MVQFYQKSPFFRKMSISWENYARARARVGYLGQYWSDRSEIFRDGHWCKNKETQVGNKKYINFFMKNALEKKNHEEQKMTKN